MADVDATLDGVVWCDGDKLFDHVALGHCDHSDYLVSGPVAVKRLALFIALIIVPFMRE